MLGATGAPLERDFAFGVVRQLFDAELHRADPARRAALLAGAAALAEPVFGAAVAEGEDASHSTLYGLYWLCANLAAEQPLLVVVDDAHWADAPSLRFLDALARRVEDLPVLLALAARPAEPGASQELLDGLATAPATRLLRPAGAVGGRRGRAGARALRRRPGVRRGLLRDHAREPAAVDRAAARRAVRGPRVGGRRRADDRARNGRADGRGADPAAVGGRARRWRGRPRCSATRRACAASRRCRGWRVDAAAAELEVLARADLIDAAEGRFIHPMVLEIVDADLGAERASLHRRAARLLAGDGAHDGVVAAHLLAAEPEPDPWAAGVLAAAGRRALAEGAPDVALRLLGRAAPADAGILLSLGLAQFRTGADPLPTLDRGRRDRHAGDRRRGHPPRRDRARPARRAARRRRPPAHDAGDAPPELAGELEEQLVEALAYSDDDADEYLALLAKIEATARPRETVPPRDAARPGDAAPPHDAAPPPAWRPRPRRPRSSRPCGPRCSGISRTPARSRARRATRSSRRPGARCRTRGCSRGSGSSGSPRCGRSRRCWRSRRRPRR